MIQYCVKQSINNLKILLIIEVINQNTSQSQFIYFDKNNMRIALIKIKQHVLKNTNTNYLFMIKYNVHGKYI